METHYGLSGLETADGTADARNEAELKILPA